MFRKLFLVCIIACISISGYTQKVLIDSLENWLNTHTAQDTMRAMTTHRLAFRYADSDPSKGWKYAKETEVLSKQLGFTKGECLANINFAILETNEANFQESADYYEKAIKIAQTIDFTRGLSISLNNIGDNYIKLKNYDKAIEYSLRALDLNVKVNEARGQAINYEQIGSAYFAKKSFGKAFENWSTGFELAKKQTDITIYTQLLIDLGTYYSQMNQLPQAFAKIKIADSIASTVDELYLQILASKAYAHAFNTMNQSDSEIAYLHKALSTALKLGQKSEICELYNLLSISYEGNKQYDSGMYYLRKHKLLGDSVLNDKNFAHIAFIQTKYETDLKEKENKQLKNIQVNQNKKLNTQNGLLIASAIALLLAFLSIFLVYRSFQNKRHNLELITQKNASDYKQQVTELEIKSLRSQMNPHFIFNSLNSIRNYIIKNEPHIASNYLAKFATLMRKILDASEQSYIFWDDEIEMLKLYLELEQMRFSQQFSYQILFTTQLEQANYKIPSMVLQPFIENAIWHGLLNKEDGHGTLTIEFKEVDSTSDELICEITDNGIGRKKSAEFKNHLKKHKSKGLDITSERLIRLSHGEIKEPIHFDDLEDEQGVGIGTRVIIRLPIN